MTTKICTKCNIEKDLNDFTNDKSKKDGKHSHCKQCKSLNDTKYKKNNIEKISENGKKYYQENSVKIKQKSKDWYENNKEHCAEIKREYNIKNKESIKLKKKQYNDNNKEWLKNYMNKYIKNKYKTDVNYRIKSIINKRLRDYIRDKTKPTLEYLGCSTELLKEWFEYQFDNKMTWDNMGTYWHIDHVKPCSSFNFENNDEIFECYNWKNLQPLCKFKNMSKGSKIDEEYIKIHYNKALLFMEFKNITIN